MKLFCSQADSGSDEPARVSVVIPCDNSSLTLPILVKRIVTVFEREYAAFEVLLIDDDSRDDTWRTIQAIAGRYPFARGFRMMRNYGQHNAILCGIRHASYPIIVTMDDDLQHPPEEAPRLVTELLDGYDLVYGTPDVEQHGLLRDFASVIFKKLLENAMGSPHTSHVSAFRAFRTSLRDAFRDYQAPHVSIDVLLSWATTRVSAIRVKHDERTIGSSNYTLRRLLTTALTLMTGFTVVPLRIASMIGFFFTATGVCLFFYVIIRYFVDGRGVPGFAFIASTITLYSGLQLFALGILGEYVARIYLRMMNRPAYLVSETTSQTERGK